MSSDRRTTPNPATKFHVKPARRKFVPSASISKTTRTGSFSDNNNNSSTTTSIPIETAELQAIRWNNITDDIIGNSDVNMTETFVKTMILEYLRYDSMGFVLQTSLCEEYSALCDVPSTVPTDFSHNNDGTELQMWVNRLFYMMIHDNQHKHAQMEAKQRLTTTAAPKGTSSILDPASSSPGVGHFDYQCPDAKFLVVSLMYMGLGAHVRHIFVAALLAGVFSNRVVLFINSQKSDGPTERPWGWASCPRKDYQCVFLPSSPCVLTKQDLANATLVPSNKLRNSPDEWEEYRDDRVLILQDVNAVWHASVPFNWTGLLAENAGAMVDRIETASNHSMPILHAAANYIPNDPRGVSIPTKTVSKIADHPFGRMSSLYSLRPNQHYHSFLDREIQSIFPPSFDPPHSFGLPVRGSEKCIRKEGTCMDFDLYMELALQQHRKGVWNRTSTFSNSNDRVQLVLTSEEASVMQQRTSYEQNSSFPFAFVVNENDPMQGSGFARDLTEDDSADFIIVSTLLVIKMQLQTKHIIGNCCSNFHKVIHDFIESGAGLVRNATFECLRDNEEQRFRMCCGTGEDLKCRPGDAGYSQNETSASEWK